MSVQDDYMSPGASDDDSICPVAELETDAAPPAANATTTTVDVAETDVPPAAVVVEVDVAETDVPPAAVVVEVDVAETAAPPAAAAAVVDVVETRSRPAAAPPTSTPVDVTAASQGNGADAAAVDVSSTVCPSAVNLCSEGTTELLIDDVQFFESKRRVIDGDSRGVENRAVDIDPRQDAKEDIVEDNTNEHKNTVKYETLTKVTSEQGVATNTSDTAVDAASSSVHTATANSNGVPDSTASTAAVAAPKDATVATTAASSSTEAPGAASDGARTGAAPLTAAAAAKSDDEPMPRFIPIWNLAKKKLHEDDSIEAWYQHKRHVMIFTDSGKPVFSRYGSEDKLAGFTGTLSAVIAKYARLYATVDKLGLVPDDGLDPYGNPSPPSEFDSIRSIVVGSQTFAFLNGGPLWYLCIANKSESYLMLRRLLQTVRTQLSSILTSSIERTLINKPNMDCRHLLEGTEPMISHNISWFARDLFGVVDGFEVLPLSVASRLVVTNILQDVQISEDNKRPGKTAGASGDYMLGGLILAGRSVVAAATSQDILPHFAAPDIICIANLILSSGALRQSESWLPICLPEFNDSGFLYCYINFFMPDVCAVLISLACDISHFHVLSNHFQRCSALLRNSGVLDEIKTAGRKSPYRLAVADIYSGMPTPVLRQDDLIHAGLFIPRLSDEAVAAAKRSAGRGKAASINYHPQQFFNSAWSSSYAADLIRIKRVIRLYHSCKDMLAGSEVPSQLLVETNHENIVVVLRHDFHFYCAFSSSVTVTDQIVEPLFASLVKSAPALFIPHPMNIG